MKKENIIAAAEQITNGTHFTLNYLKPADVLNLRNYLKSIGTPEEELPKMKEGGSKPSKVLYKRVVYSLDYDERDYFRQVREELGENLYPEKKESDYTHIRGAHHQKADKDGVVHDYIRFCIRKDRLQTQVKFTTDKKGKSEVTYKDIEKYLQMSARREYEHYNRQITPFVSTGHLPDANAEIIQMTLDADKVLSVKLG